MLLIINLTECIFQMVSIFCKSFQFKYFTCLFLFIFFFSLFYTPNTHDVIALTNNNIFDSQYLTYTGTINSIYLPPDFKDEINSDAIMQNSYVIGGKWKIEINKDELVYFKANLSMMDLNGNFKHNHILTYMPEKHGIAILPDLVQIKKNNNDNSFSEKKEKISEISFKVRVKLITEGITEPNDITISVTIKKDSLLIIKINQDSRIKDHFKQPIFGIVEKTI